MLTFRFWLLFLCLPIFLTAQNPNPDPLIDQEILTLMQDLELPGVSTVIVKDGEIIWRESYGWKDFTDLSLVEDNTAFLLASISKTYTATALLKLYDQDSFQLDDPVNDYLPFEVNHPNFSDEPITFRMLLTHTGTIKDNWNVMDQYYTLGDPVVSLSEFLESLLSESGSNYDPAENFYNYAPGSNYAYSNLGAALIGLLVEEISGMPFDQYCVENIFEPLCMENTSWFLSGFEDTSNIARPHYFENGVYVPIAHFGFPDYPDGLLRSSITDVANYLVAYTGGGAFYDNEVLESTTIDEAWSDQIPDIYAGQGLIWYEELIFHDNGSKYLWGHNGGEAGTTTDMYFDPENNIGFAVLANGGGNAIEISDILYNLALNLDGNKLAPVDCFNVSSTTDLQQLNAHLYPNPANEVFYIHSPKGREEKLDHLEVCDINGQMLKQIRWNGTEKQILSARDLIPGFYTILLRSAEGLVLQALPLIIQK